MVIEVTVPLSMAMLRYFPVETVVGSYLQAAVTMKASNGNAILQNILECAFSPLLVTFLSDLTFNLQVPTFIGVMCLIPS